MIKVILVEPEHEMNVGAVVRAMANFDVNKLILVNPQCDHKGDDAIKYAKHAKNILKTAKVVKTLDKTSCSTLIATTAQVGRDYNINRSPISPKQLNEILPKKGTVGLVFGREGHGLFNDEVKQCDFVVTIPSSKKYSTLNLSHSVAVVLYELFQKTDKPKRGGNIVFVGAKEKKQLLLLLEKTLQKLPFTTEEKRETQRIVWKRMISKSFLSRREASALMGFLRKVVDKKQK